SAMEDPDLVAKVMRDIVFLEVAGINPIVVHGGGKAISAAMEKAGISAGGVSRDVLFETVARILEANPAETGVIIAGGDTAVRKRKYLMGLVMKEIRGQAAGEEVSAAFDAVLCSIRERSL
ncbi:MAG: hypothetical protein RQ767_03020, partial [Thermovirgaceae bacterium]|nr:hypothetical protein [Thermovirgaceae bacterium]